MADAERNFIQNRVNLPTSKTSAEISRDIPPEIRARAFFSARVAEAHILERFRKISDAYSSGRIGRDEARHLLRQYAVANGKDDGTESLKNLASTARLNLILDQNAKMARAVGQYEAMHRPANLQMFPYVIYRASVGSKDPRGDHQKYDGMVIDKRDPWLKTHWPPWEFGCNCDLSNCTAKKAEKLGVKPMTPADKVKIDSRSDFAFDPSEGFELYNISSLQPISRSRIIEQAAEAVRNQKLGSCGLVVAPAELPLKPVSLPGLDEVKKAFEKMKPAAEQELRAVGLSPNDLPDYQVVNNAFKKAGVIPENIKSVIRNLFPENDIIIGKLSKRAAEAAGLPQLPVTLGRGNTNRGIEHLWRHHKDIFTAPELAEKILRETLGNENCRVVVSLKRASEKQRGKKIYICLKRIVLHNPTTKSYCVLVADRQELHLVSWHTADDAYGNNEWNVK